MTYCFRFWRFPCCETPAAAAAVGVSNPVLHAARTRGTRAKGFAAVGASANALTAASGFAAASAALGKAGGIGAASVAIGGGAAGKRRVSVIKYKV